MSFPAALVDREDSVDLWLAPLDLSPALLAPLVASLDAGERAEAARVRLHPGRFLAARGVRRAILARYAGVPAEKLSFARGPYGKPRLDPPGDLRFSASRAGGIALVAVSREREVGVDVERIRRDYAWQPVARHFGSASEARALAFLPAEARAEAFFMAWVRKEAVLKAAGTGLAVSPAQVEVSIGPDEPAALHAVPGGLGTIGEYRLRSLSILPGYAVAVCTRK